MKESVYFSYMQISKLEKTINISKYIKKTNQLIINTIKKVIFKSSIFYSVFTNKTKINVCLLKLFMRLLYVIGGFM